MEGVRLLGTDAVFWEIGLRPLGHSQSCRAHPARGNWRFKAGRVVIDRLDITMVSKLGELGKSVAAKP